MRLLLLLFWWLQSFFPTFFLFSSSSLLLLLPSPVFNIKTVLLFHSTSDCCCCWCCCCCNNHLDLSFFSSFFASISVFPSHYWGPTQEHQQQFDSKTASSLSFFFLLHSKRPRLNTTAVTNLKQSAVKRQKQTSLEETFTVRHPFFHSLSFVFKCHSVFTRFLFYYFHYFAHTKLLPSVLKMTKFVWNSDRTECSWMFLAAS